MDNCLSLRKESAAIIRELDYLFMFYESSTCTGRFKFINPTTINSLYVENYMFFNIKDLVAFV